MNLSIPCSRIAVRTSFAENNKNILREKLEATSGFGPLNGSFADSCLTTWLRRPTDLFHFIQTYQGMQTNLHSPRPLWEIFIRNIYLYKNQKCFQLPAVESIIMYGTGVVILGRTVYERSYFLFSCVGCYRLNSSACSRKSGGNSSNVFVNSSGHSSYRQDYPWLTPVRC